jgi:WD40 repeat protein
MNVLEGDGDTRSVRAVAWAPDSRTLASGYTGGNGRIWDAETGEVKHVLEQIHINTLAFSPDGCFLAAGSYRGSLCLWDTATGKRLPRQCDSYDTRLAWSLDGKTLLTDSRRWNVFTEDMPRDISSYTSVFVGRSLCECAWAPNRKTFTWAHSAEWIRQCDAETGDVNHRLTGHRNSTYDVAWSPDGKFIASTSPHGHDGVRLWNAETGASDIQIERSSLALAWSPSGDLLALATNEAVELWRPTEAQVVARFEGATTQLRSIDWSTDGKFLATGDDAGTAHIWDVESHQLLKTLQTQEGEEIRSVKWSADSKLLGLDGPVQVWNSDSGTLVHKLLKHRVRIAWSNHDSMLAWRLRPMGSPDAAFHVWNATTDQVQQKKKPRDIVLLGTQDRIRKEMASHAALAWTPDDTSLVCSADGLLVWCDLKSDRYRCAYSGHAQAADSLSFSPDGTRLVTSSELDNMLWVWDWPNKQRIASLMVLPYRRLDDPIPNYRLAVSTDGHYRSSEGIESEIVYVVQTEQGQETLTPAEFSKRYGWKNDPNRVRLSGNATGPSKPSATAK